MTVASLNRRPRPLARRRRRADAGASELGVAAIALWAAAAITDSTIDAWPELYELRQIARDELIEAGSDPDQPPAWAVEVIASARRSR